MYKSIVAGLLVLSYVGSAIGADSDILISGPAGLTIRRLDIDADIKRVPLELRKDMLAKPANIKRMAMNLYLRRVLADEAEKAGQASDPLIAQQILQAREKVLTEVRVHQLDGVPPSDGELEALALAEYKANQDRYKINEERRVSHILVGKHRSSGRALAEELLSRVKANPEMFNTLALQFSDDPGSKGKSGEMAAFGRGKMVKQFDDAAFALTPSDPISPIFETEFGWHIIKLIGQTESGLTPFESVKNELKRNILAKLMENRRQPVMQSIEEAAVVNDDVISAIAMESR